MRRCEFITVLGAAAFPPTAWPLSASSQQATLPVVGWLNSAGPAANPLYASLVKAFQAALKDAGYVDGHNIQIDFRWGEGQYARLPSLAGELVARGAAVILAGGPPAAVAAKAATQTIPIVFTSGDDPVRLGLVASFNRPGGNCTGVSELADEIDEKRLGLLHDVVPNAATIAVLLNPKSASFAAQTKQLQQAARTKGFQLALLGAATEQHSTSLRILGNGPGVCTPVTTCSSTGGECRGSCAPQIGSEWYRTPSNTAASENSPQSAAPKH